MAVKKYELLLPVGSIEMALAAIHNGADAIYVGFPGYNARGRSIDFEVEELRNIIQTCHLYGVKAHLALNIVIFQNELENLIEALARILPLKPDALIIQDLGLSRLIRKMAPDQVIHASTQMTVTNHEAIALLDDLNIKRFVLGRENSLPEIALIKAQTEKDLEVFVHGALCVSYSGQCFTSESIGGRSANRGQCAQSCRFAYEMIVNGEKKSLIQKQYLLSPQDLCGVAEIPQLMDLGINSFKIEGRLKSPEYVAAATQEYRQAIDQHLRAHNLSEKEVDLSKKRMATTYSRGFFTGWLHGVDHQQLVNGSSKSHRGYPIGSIFEVHRNKIWVELNHPVKLSPGDGLLWVYWMKGEQFESGAQIYQIKPAGKNQYEIHFGKDIEIQETATQAKLFLNHIAQQKRELKRSFQDRNYSKQIPIDLTVDINLQTPLKVTASDGQFICTAYGKCLVQEAKNQAISDEFIKDELAALGGSAFTLNSFKVIRETNVGVFYSHKELKEIRRQLTTELERLRSENRITCYETTVISRDEMLSWLDQQKHELIKDQDSSQNMKLNVLLREKTQVFDFIEAWQKGHLDKAVIDCVILDFEFGMDYEPSTQALRENGIRTGIATTRVLKPKEYTHFTRIERLAPDVLLIRNLGALHYFTSVKPFQGELRGDFSLNVTNHITAEYLLSKGLKTVTASYDLNSDQVSDLLSAANASRLEITAHQYMPSFHMEHCVFAAFLSTGSSFRDCGKPCEKHRVELKDQFGNRHQLKPDPECRNTMYNATSQSAARFIKPWKQKGLGFIRYEALYEKGRDLIDKIRGYQDIISGKRTAEQVISELKLLEKYGLGEGAITKAHEYQSRKKT